MNQTWSLFAFLYQKQSWSFFNEQHLETGYQLLYNCLPTDFTLPNTFLYTNSHIFRELGPWAKQLGIISIHSIAYIDLLNRLANISLWPSVYTFEKQNRNVYISIHCKERLKGCIYNGSCSHSGGTKWKWQWEYTWNI